MDLPVMPTIKPMLAKGFGDQLPDGDGLVFEPKWDGFRCLIFRDGDDLFLQSRNEKEFNRYVPELIEPLLAQLPERCVLDGELVVITPERELGFEALQQRIHPAKSRVDRLAAETPTSFIAFDLLALGNNDLRDTGFAARRELLAQSLAGATPPIYLTPATTDRDIAAEWFIRFEGAGLDGLIAKPPDGPYLANKRSLWKVKHKRTCDCVAAGYRTHKSGDGPGSIMLGIFSEDGSLRHVGVATSFSAKRRVELIGELAPYHLPLEQLDQHPWSAWASPESHDGESMLPGAPNRWNANKDQSWEPLDCSAVVEVGYEGLLSGRLRHSGRFVRWRHDKEPTDCTYDQFEPLEAITVDEILDVPAP